MRLRMGLLLFGLLLSLACGALVKDSDSAAEVDVSQYGNASIALFGTTQVDRYEVTIIRISDGQMVHQGQLDSTPEGDTRLNVSLPAGDYRVVLKAYLDDSMPDDCRPCHIEPILLGITTKEITIAANARTDASMKLHYKEPRNHSGEAAISIGGNQAPHIDRVLAMPFDNEGNIRVSVSATDDDNTPLHYIWAGQGFAAATEVDPPQNIAGGPYADGNTVIVVMDEQGGTDFVFLRYGPQPGEVTTFVGRAPCENVVCQQAITECKDELSECINDCESMDPTWLCRLGCGMTYALCLAETAAVQ